MQLAGERKPSAVNNTGMVAVITNDVVTFSDNHGKHTLIDRESCRKTEAFILMNVFGNFFFQLHMQIERSV